MTMSAYKDLSGMFTNTAIEVDEEDIHLEQRTAMNTSLEKVFNMENRYSLFTCAFIYITEIGCLDFILL